MSLNQHQLSNGFLHCDEQVPGLASASIGVWALRAAPRDAAAKRYRALSPHGF
jgi:hypothetical protein